MNKQSIQINLLVSPKAQLDYKMGKYAFGHMISDLRAKGRVDQPIEVYKLNSGKYYIANGVHRSKAAELAKLNTIDAFVFSDSAPFGPMTPLKDVKIW
jgi:hypothetical protein